MKKKNISLLIFISLCIHSLTLTLSKNLLVSNINIPTDYISDSTFISMMYKNPITINTIYASPEGSGNICSDTSPCSLENAFKSLSKGYTLLLKGGKYNVKSGLSLESSGIPKLYIRISSAPNERAIITSTEKEKIVLFSVEGSYIIIENIIFQGVEAIDVQGIGILNGGQNHIIIRNNIFDSLSTPKIDEDYGANGILLYGENELGIKKVIIYNNTLTNNILGYSEAISVAGNCEEIYVINNYLSNNTNIGIDFYGNAQYCPIAELDQPRKSVAIKNYIEKSNSPYDDCAGLYIDGAKDIYVADNIIKNSQFGIEIGSEERNDLYPVNNIIVKNNIVSDNIVTGLRIGGYEEIETGIVQNCSLIENIITRSHTAVIISKSKDIKFYGNQFIDIDKYFIDMEFSEIYIKNIEFVNNIFSGNGNFRLYGATKLTLDEFIEEYPSNKKK